MFGWLGPKSKCWTPCPAPAPTLLLPPINMLQENFVTEKRSHHCLSSDLLWLWLRTARIRSFSNCYFCYFSGFYETFESRELPDIKHTNQDGRLPVIEVNIKGPVSRVQFSLCRKQFLGDTENIGLRLPYAVHITEEVILLWQHMYENSVVSLGWSRGKYDSYNDFLKTLTDDSTGL